MSPRPSCATALVAVFVASFTLTPCARAHPATGEAAFRVGQGICVFDANGWDPEYTPSLALVTEPAELGPVPPDWKIKPVFSKNSAGQFQAHVDAPEGTSFYGTGEVTGPLLRNNTKITLWNTDNYEWKKDDGSRLYQSHPWVLGVRPDGTAFGVIFDTTWKSTLECGDHDITFTTFGPVFRAFVIDRATPQAVLQGLAQLTGTMPLPPRWALGFQQCRYSYFPDARVREIAAEFRKRQIPCDVIWLDIDYMNGYRIFTFDPTRFPNPAATNNYLHSLGFKSIWMIDPGVKAEKGYAVYDSGSKINAWVKSRDGSEYHGTVWPGLCAFPDFTSPAVRKWWSGLYPAFMVNGIDGVWNDMNEPSVFDGPDHTMPETNLHAGGEGLPPGPHLEYHNVYGMLMVRASREGIAAAKPAKRPFVLTRANYLGGQRYAATWTGDNGAGWDYLKSSVPMSLNLGLSGQPFSGPDIGGYMDPATPELFGNWIGTGAFFPFCRAHKSKGMPNSEPWEFGPEVETAARAALERRYRLLPYLYTLFQEATQDGQPVMRPVFFADPTDPSLRGEQQAFTVGNDLLVVPKWAKDPKLPKGNWRDVILTDPAREASPYIPALKIRPGAIVPLGRVVQNTIQKSFDPLTLLVSLDDSGKADGTLYEDAGDGYDYRKNGYALTHYHAEKQGNVVMLTVKDRTGGLPSDNRTVLVEILTTGHPVYAHGIEAAGIRCPLQ